MSITAVIPARGGSKGLPGKNIRIINGKPLIVWSIEQALACQKVQRVLVSTDSEEIAHIAKSAGAEVPELRPAILAQDTTPTEPVLAHAIQNWCDVEEDHVVLLLQPTSPLRLPLSIDNAINTFYNQKADSLASVSDNHSFFWKNIETPVALYDYKNRPRRQDILPSDRWYRENGSIYLTKVSVLLAHNNRLGGKIAMHKMHECESWEIDTEIDFHFIEELMAKNNF
ncbi:MAG: hypothetical protein RL416_145 [Pseudomonadota bacterium]|jgi:N-acylneuraminate cytidylyltransferase